MALKIGSTAPEISQAADDGSQFQLSSMKGQRVVLFFYPKADTPG